MKKQIVAYEAYLKGPDSIFHHLSLQEQLSLLTNYITWMQHERLIHLIVTLFTGLAFLYSFTLFLFISNWVTFSLLFIVGILFFLYILHYYYLENYTQALYLQYLSQQQKKT